jgi:hypothetical protein
VIGILKGVVSFKIYLQEIVFKAKAKYANSNLDSSAAYSYYFKAMVFY